MKNLVSIVAFFLVVMGGWSALGQSKKQWQQYGDLSFAEKDYLGASVYYQRASIYGSEDLELLWKYSHSLLLSKNYIEAEKKFTDLVSKDTVPVYVDSKLWLGVLLKNNGKYLKAKEIFSDFLTIKNISLLQKQKAINELEGCELALNSENSEGILISSVKEVNTPYAEFAAFFWGKEELFFSSQRQELPPKEEFESLERYPVKLYRAKNDKNGLPQITELSDVLNNAGYHVCNVTKSLDGRYLYFSACDQGFSCEIMASKYSYGVWSKPVKLNDKINIPGYNSTQPSICKIGDQEIMLFVTDRPGGLGKLDIWYAIKKGDLDFADPVNLGSTINSIEDDVCPWYAEADSVLYFSSSWWPGYGGYDVFVSKGLLKKMSKPANLGRPINSSCNDLYFSINTEDKVANLTSNRAGSLKDSLGNFNDLWQVTWQSETKEAIASINPDTNRNTVQAAQSLLPLQLFFHNDQPVAGKNDTTSKYDYKQAYLQYISLQDEYSSRNNYAGKEMSNEIDDFFENQIRGGFEKLNQLCELLLLSVQQGEDIVIGIKGFASLVGNAEYNNLLSRRRLSALEQYISSYKSGVLLPYLNNDKIGGSLRIIRLPFEINTVTGQAKKADQIYGLEAANARKIEIYNLTLLGIE